MENRKQAILNLLEEEGFRVSDSAAVLADVWNYLYPITQTAYVDHETCDNIFHFLEEVPRFFENRYYSNGIYHFFTTTMDLDFFLKVYPHFRASNFYVDYWIRFTPTSKEGIVYFFSYIFHHIKEPYTGLNFDFNKLSKEGEELTLEQLHLLDTLQKYPGVPSSINLHDKRLQDYDFLKKTRQMLEEPQRKLFLSSFECLDKFPIEKRRISDWILNDNPDASLNSIYETLTFSNLRCFVNGSDHFHGYLNSRVFPLGAEQYFFSFLENKNIPQGKKEEFLSFLLTSFLKYSEAFHEKDPVYLSLVKNSKEQDIDHGSLREWCFFLKEILERENSSELLNALSKIIDFLVEELPSLSFEEQRKQRKNLSKELRKEIELFYGKRNKEIPWSNYAIYEFQDRIVNQGRMGVHYILLIYEEYCIQDQKEASFMGRKTTNPVKKLLK